jgi:hypothetical protein
MTDAGDVWACSPQKKNVRNMRFQFSCNGWISFAMNFRLQLSYKCDFSFVSFMEEDKMGFRLEQR